MAGLLLMLRAAAALNLQVAGEGVCPVDLEYRSSMFQLQAFLGHVELCLLLPCGVIQIRAQTSD
jgi:hypothetical protein